METMPFSSVALVIVVLLVIWFFLAHMISSRKDDARLQFLFDLIDVPSPDGGHSDPEGQRTAAIVPGKGAAKPLQEGADECVSRGISSVARYAFQELPVVFAAALRSRAM
jgi:hypothetical protein